MKLPYSWLCELVNGLPEPERVAETLTMRGFEVEELARPGRAIQDVVVAKILSMRPHPDADKLTLCEVTDGHEQYSIVCGAKNMNEGDCVALARVGVVLPGNFKIEKRKIRGETSLGMLCSSRELGLGDEHEGIMILPKDSPLGKPLIDVLGLNETVFDINVTPNRPDALSVLGIARELAAAFGSTVRMPDCSAIDPASKPDLQPPVELIDADLCPRYTALIIDNIQIGPSPDWVVKRLEACGVRSVNNVVDATNLVLMELGQPLHAFDLHTLNEERIVVRRAQSGETLVSIDGDKRTLTEDMLVIADAKQPVAIAGVMGGLDSEVGDRTHTILLESAYFLPASIRRTAKQLGMRSEASYRFERGVDFETVVPASYRCARLIQELTGGKVVGRMTVADTGDQGHIRRLGARELSLSYEYCDRLLGKPVERAEIDSIFKSLNISIIVKTETQVNVRVPSYRQDITRPADLVEEIARCHGYNEFSPTLPVAPIKAPEPQVIDRGMVQRIRDYLIGGGLDESVTYSFTSAKALEDFPTHGSDLYHDTVTIQNPINAGETTMRTSLLPSLLQSAKRNLAHGNSSFGLFEIAKKYFILDNELIEQPAVAFILVGNPFSNWRNFKSELDFFDAKGIAEQILSIGNIARYRLAPGPQCLHPKRGIGIQYANGTIGYYGELNPALRDKYELIGRVLVAEIDLRPLSESYRSSQPTYRAYSIFPAVKRDLALVAPVEVATGDIEKAIRKTGGELLEDISLFDYYRGKQVSEGTVSAGFRLTFRSREETLTEERIDSLIEAILNDLKTMGVYIRS